jgi:hypothetical protein
MSKFLARGYSLNTQRLEANKAAINLVDSDEDEDGSARSGCIDLRSDGSEADCGEGIANCGRSRAASEIVEISDDDDKG